MIADIVRASIDAPVWDHFAVEVRAYGRFPGRTVSPLAEVPYLIVWDFPNFRFLEGQWQTVARVHTLRARLGRDWRAGFGLSAGVTVAMSLDISSFEAAERTFRVGPTVGAFFEAGKGPFSLRMRYEHDAYVQTVNDTTLEPKNNAVLGMEGMWWVR